MECSLDWQECTQNLVPSEFLVKKPGFGLGSTNHQLSFGVEAANLETILLDERMNSVQVFSFGNDHQHPTLLFGILFNQFSPHLANPQTLFQLNTASSKQGSVLPNAVSNQVILFADMDACKFCLQIRGQHYQRLSHMRLVDKVAAVYSVDLEEVQVGGVTGYVDDVFELFLDAIEHSFLLGALPREEVQLWCREVEVGMEMEMEMEMEAGSDTEQHQRIQKCGIIRRCVSGPECS